MKKLLIGLSISMVSMVAHAEEENPIVRLKILEQRVNNLEKEVRILKLGQSREQAPLSDSEVGVWSAKAIETIYHYSFNNYSTVLENIRHYFTVKGYENYMKALQASNNLQAIQDKKLNVRAKASSEAIVQKLGEGKWLVKLPTQVTYQGPNESFTQNLIVNIEVVKAQEIGNLQGIAIDDLSAEVAH